MRPAGVGGYGPSVASIDPDLHGLRRVVVRDGVVTRPAAAWSPTVHAFLRYLRSQD